MIVLSRNITQVHKFKWDTAEVDKDFVVDETSEYLYISPVTFAREGVLQYEDGRALKPGDELEKAAQISRMYIAWNHPPLKVITKRNEIKGIADSIASEKDGKGVKVKGGLTWFKHTMTQDQQELIRSGARRDVSLGFYYIEDRTPGKWNGEPYDYVQRELLFDHVASVDHGRCTYPQCGIGVDASQIRIGNDPYPNEHSCRIEDPEKFQPNSFRRITQGKLEIIIGRLKGKTTTTTQAFRYPKSKWTAAAARTHCEKQGGRFEAASSDQRNEIMRKEDADWGEKFNPTDVHLRIAEVERENCAECIFYAWQDNTCRIVAGPVAANLVCDEFTGKASLEEIVAHMRGTMSDETKPSQSTCQGLTGERAIQLMRNLMAMDRQTLVNYHRSLHKTNDLIADSRVHDMVLFALRKKAKKAT